MTIQTTTNTDPPQMVDASTGGDTTGNNSSGNIGESELVLSETEAGGQDLLQNLQIEHTDQTQVGVTGMRGGWS